MKKQLYIFVLIVSILGVIALQLVKAQEPLELMSDSELLNVYGGCKVMCEGYKRCERDWIPASAVTRASYAATCTGDISEPCDYEWGGTCVYDEYNPPYMWCSWMTPTPECSGEYKKTHYYHDWLGVCNTTETMYSCGDKVDCQTEGTG